MTQADADEKVKNWIAENPALHIAEKTWWFNPNILSNANWTVKLWKAYPDKVMAFEGGSGEHFLSYSEHFIWASRVPK